MMKTFHHGKDERVRNGKRMIDGAKLSSKYRPQSPFTLNSIGIKVNSRRREDIQSSLQDVDSTLQSFGIKRVIGDRCKGNREEEQTRQHARHVKLCYVLLFSRPKTAVDKSVCIMARERGAEVLCLQVSRFRDHHQLVQTRYLLSPDDFIYYSFTHRSLFSQ